MSSSLLNVLLFVSATLSMETQSADYLLIIRNTDIYDLYINQSIIQYKIQLAINEYFNISFLYTTNIESIEYESTTHDTNIEFVLTKIENEWNNEEINNLYTSTTNSQFYYLLSSYLNLTWNHQNSIKDAKYIQQQYDQNEIQIKRDFINIFLTDIPFSADTDSDHNIKTTVTPNYDTTTTITNTIMDTQTSTLYINNINDNLVDSDNNQQHPSQIMSWGTFITIVIILVLLIIVVTFLIFYVNRQTDAIQGIGSKYGLAGGRENSTDVSSVECAPMMKNGGRKVSNIGSEGRGESGFVVGGRAGLRQIDERKAQPPSIQIVGMPARKPQFKNQERSMPFDVHLSDVVVGDAIVMDDIIEDINDNDNEDEEDQINVPIGHETPGGAQDEDIENVRKNKDIEYIEDDEDDDDDKVKVDVDDYGDLTPGGSYLE